MSGPLASLSSGLLARKGSARPAMRPQSYAPLNGRESIEDLGWNDMGSESVAVAGPAPVAELRAPEPEAWQPAQEHRQPTPEPVLKSVSVATAERLERETSHVGRAAFTLRLDSQRHLRLRLASAINNKSAQALVTQALDVFLMSLPQVEALVAQLPVKKSGR